MAEGQGQSEVRGHQSPDRPAATAASVGQLQGRTSGDGHSGRSGQGGCTEEVNVESCLLVFTAGDFAQ